MWWWSWFMMVLGCRCCSGEFYFWGNLSSVCACALRWFGQVWDRGSGWFPFRSFSLFFSSLQINFMPLTSKPIWAILSKIAFTLARKLSYICITIIITININTIERMSQVLLHLDPDPCEIPFVRLIRSLINLLSKFGVTGLCKWPQWRATEPLCAAIDRLMRCGIYSDQKIPKLAQTFCIINLLYNGMWINFALIKMITERNGFDLMMKATATTIFDFDQTVIVIWFGIWHNTHSIYKFQWINIKWLTARDHNWIRRLGFETENPKPVAIWRCW